MSLPVIVILGTPVPNCVSRLLLAPGLGQPAWGWACVYLCARACVCACVRSRRAEPGCRDPAARRPPPADRRPPPAWCRSSWQLPPSSLFTWHSPPGAQRSRSPTQPPLLQSFSADTLAKEGLPRELGFGSCALEWLFSQPLSALSPPNPSRVDFPN